MKRSFLVGILSTLWISAVIPAPLEAFQMEFSADSLGKTSGSHIFSYPGADRLNVNRRLSLPVITLYFESATALTESDFVVDPADHTYLGTIPAEDRRFDNGITGTDSVVHSSLLHDFDKLRGNILEINPASLNGKPCLAVSFLPVTIDSSYNLIFSGRIALRPDREASLVGHADKLIDRLASEESSRRNTKVLSGRADNRLPLGEEYVVVTGASLSESFLPLILFKNSCGVSAAWADIDSILNYYSGIDGSEKLRNYLKDFYQSGGKYVLLGGDETVLPVRYLLYYNAGNFSFNHVDLMPSDLYFADLTGEWDWDGDGIWGEPTDDKPDFVPELKVGRLPLKTPQAVQNYVSNLLRYCTDPGNGNCSYLNKSLFFSSDEMRDYPAEGQHGVIAAMFPSNFVTDTLLGVELPSGASPNPTNPDGANGIREISEGYGIVNIIAHGRKDGFVVKSANYGDWPASFILTSPVTGGHGSVLDLEKNGLTSFYYSLACDVGGYDLDSVNGSPADLTLVERLLSSENSGAVGMVANSRWGWVYSSYLLHQSFFKYLFGQAEGNPCDAMRYSWLDYPYLRDLIYGQNFFGDPSLEIYRQVPRRLNLAVESTGEGQYQIALTSKGCPVANVDVIMAQNGVVLETGETDANGKWAPYTSLNYDSLYTLTAMAEGYVTLQDNYSPSIAADVKDDKNILPDAFYLGQNYPNPFNPSTSIEYTLPERAEAHFEIFNLLGQLIRLINVPMKPAGRYSIEWDGRNNDGRETPSGIYFYRLTAERFSETKKMILLR